MTSALQGQQSGDGNYNMGVMTCGQNATQLAHDSTLRLALEP
jgi:hypothetical protein